VNVSRAAERFIEQKDRGFVDQRAAELRALLHAARQLPRHAIGEARQPNLGQQGFRALAIFRAVLVLPAAIGLDDLQRQASRCRECCAMAARWRSENAMPTVLSGRSTSSSSTLTLSSVRSDQAGNQLEQGRFAASARPTMAEEFAVGDAEIGR